MVAEPAVAKPKVRPNKVRRRIIGDARADCLEEGPRNVTDADSESTKVCIDVDDTAKRHSIACDQVSVREAVRQVVGADPQEDGRQRKQQ